MSVLYENLGEVPSINSVIPNGCLSFYEQSLYVAEFAEQNFNEMFEAIGVNELAVFENTGSFIVYEDSSLKSFKESAKRLFQNIWGAIKAAYEKILKWFEDKRKEAVKELIKIDASVADKMEDDKNYGKTHKFDLSVSDNFISEANALVSKATTEFDKLIKNPTDALKDDAKKVKEDLESSIVASISKTDAKTVGDARKSLLNKMVGESVDVNKSWVKNNISEVVGIVEKGNTKKDIQKSYKDEKANIDKIIKELGNLDKSLIDVAKAEITVLKSISTCLHSCMNVKMDVCKKRYGEYRNILVKLSKLNKKEKATNESVTYQQDLIESAFDW